MALAACNLKIGSKGGADGRFQAHDERADFNRRMPTYGPTQVSGAPAATLRLRPVSGALNLLMIVPPYRYLNCPPAGAAALLGYLSAAGHDFAFADLRLLMPDVLAPTYNPVGLFGESYVIDIPDLPLVLSILQAWDEGSNLVGWLSTEWLDNYCLERGLQPSQLRRYMQGVDQMIEASLLGFPDAAFVGFSVWTSNFATTLLAAARLKRRANPPFIVAGGPQVTESRNAALLGLRAGLFDAVVVGEGEAALAELYEAWTEGRSLEAIPGTLRREAQGGAARGPHRKLLHLTALPEPAFDRLSLADYRNDSGMLKLPFQLSRGCTDKCSFCSEWVFWEHFRLDTVEHSIDTLESLSRRYGVRHFHFTDSLINGHKRRLAAFAESLITRPLSISWGGFMRADMDSATATLLSRAGLSYAYIGVESFSDETLKLMNKRRTEADNIRSVRAFLEAGIAVSIGVIPGFPGDTRERFLKTVRTLTALRDEHPLGFSFNVEPFILSPSQPIYSRLGEVGLSMAAWPDDVLAFAPRYADIAAQVGWRVEGANQGLERLGQFSLLRSLAGETRAVGQDLVVDRLSFIRIGELSLCQASHRGRIVGALLTQEEREAASRLVSTAKPGPSPLELPVFSAFWAEVLAKHELPPTLTVQADGDLRTTENWRWAQTPGHVAARSVEGGCHMIIANCLTGMNVSAPTSLVPVLRWLAETPRERMDVETALSRCGVEAVDWLHRLAEAGLVRPTPAPAAGPEP
jgi:hypothetical protein